MNAPQTEMEKLGKRLANTAEAIKTIPTEKLEKNLINMKKWAKDAPHTLEKMVWRDLIKITKRELKHRGTRLE